MNAQAEKKSAPKMDDVLKRMLGTPPSPLKKKAKQRQSSPSKKRK